jgi:hypothetical protein
MPRQMFRRKRNIGTIPNVRARFPSVKQDHIVFYSLRQKLQDALDAKEGVVMSPLTLTPL